jgi:uncharacterized protein
LCPPCNSTNFKSSACLHLIVNRPFIVTIAAIAIVVLAIGALIYIAQPGHSPKPAGQNATVTPHPDAVDLVSGNGTVMRMDVEIADTPAEQEHGLMNRSSMAENAGMLFVWDYDVQMAFWMDNTLIPLDMIFIADNLTIVDIQENATPLSKDLIRSSLPYRYVLEVNGGLCAADDIDIGGRVSLDLG